MKKVNWLVVAAGLVVGTAAVLLTALGNPGNMGFCIACFLRDTSGALGLHSAGVVQYIRPEIVGLVLGSFIVALCRKEFSAKGGSAPVTRSGCSGSAPLQMGCPGSQADTLHQGTDTAVPMRSAPASRLMQWPVQIKLLPVQAPFYQGARLLIAADCTAFSRADFHERFMKGRITLIGCPKLDEGDYTEKLTEIIRCNDIREVTIVRMEVPCCGGLQRAAETALRESGKLLPWQVVTLGRDGTIQE